MTARTEVKKPRKPMSGLERTESDMEEAIRQKMIMTPTLAWGREVEGGGRRVGELTSRLGVMESLDLSISQAGVEETNLEKMEEGEAGEGGQEEREGGRVERTPVDDDTWHFLLPLIEYVQEVSLPLVTNIQLRGD